MKQVDPGALMYYKIKQVDCILLRKSASKCGKFLKVAISDNSDTSKVTRILNGCQ